MLRIQRLGMLGSTLSIGSQVEVVRKIETTFEELLNTFADGLELVLFLGVAAYLKGNQLNILQFKYRVRFQHVNLQIVMYSTYFFSAHYYH